MCEELGAVCTEKRKDWALWHTPGDLKVCIFILSPSDSSALIMCDCTRLWPNEAAHGPRLMCNPVESLQVFIPEVAGSCRTEVLQQQSAQTKEGIISQPRQFGEGGDALIINRHWLSTSVRAKMTPSQPPCTSRIKKDEVHFSFIRQAQQGNWTDTEVSRCGLPGRWQQAILRQLSGK